MFSTGQLQSRWPGYRLIAATLAIMATAGTSTESIYFNFTDPNVEGSTVERASLEHPHPAFTDFAVRQAMSYAIDRDTIANEFYGHGQLAAWSYLVGLPALDNGHLP